MSSIVMKDYKDGSSYKSAIEAVIKRVKSAKTSFELGLRVLPKEQRIAMYTLYAFCREVDDIADDSLSSDIAKKGLAEWRNRIEKLFNNNKVQDDISIALYPAIIEYKLQKQDLLDVIDGMEMDSVAIVAPDIETLDEYCDKVASAVGRSFIRICGSSDDAAMNIAYHLGRAFQLTNILRDIYEDSQRGRLYLPKELLVKHHILQPEQEHIDIQKVIFHSELPNVCKELSNIAKHHYELTKISDLESSKASQKSIRLMQIYYSTILDQLCQKNWQDITKRVSLSTMKKIRLLIMSMFS